MATGYGVESLTFRQFINVCYTMVVEQFQGSQEEGGDTIEDQVNRFEEQIGLRHNPDDDAVAALREWQLARGIDPDKASKEEVKPKNWWEGDHEL